MSTPIRPTRPRPSQRGNPSLGDILRTVFVLGAMILAVWFVANLVYSKTPEDVVPKVDHVAAIAEARAVASYPIVAPRDLPSGWRANGARFEPAETQQPWHLGVITEDGEYIGLDQAKRSVDAMVRSYARGSKAAGEAEFGGIEWSVRRGPGSSVAYVRTVGDSVVIVVSDADRDDVERYVASLSSD